MQQSQWSNKLGFILASAGSAIGLGVIWKLPYVTGTSGGGAFLLLFFLFSFFIGFPLLLGEFLIGKSTQKGAIGAYKTIAPEGKWHYIGYLGIFTNFLLLSFYSVIGGWIIHYCFIAIKEFFVSSDINYVSYFGEMVSNAPVVFLCQTIFLGITVYVVSKGIQGGIEKASKFLMPVLFIVFLILIVRSVTLDNAIEGVKFFLYPSFDKITSESILYAMGQAFFSLSLGVSVMITYSSYLSKRENIVTPAVSVVVMNLLISILAGLAIFPAVFSFGFSPEEGPGLLFIVLPNVFNEMMFGQVFFFLFIFLFLFATLTSAFSMLEVLVASLTKGVETKRKKWSILSGVGVFVLGIPSVLSFSSLSEFTPFGRTFFDNADYIVSNILMPTGALLVAIFVAHRMEKTVLKSEFITASKWSKVFFTVWYLLIKYVIPAVIILVFLDTMGIFG